MGMNHFKNSVNTCFVHNDTLDLLRNLQQVSYSAETWLYSCFSFVFPASTEAKLSPELYFLIWQYLENKLPPQDWKPDKYTESVFIHDVNLRVRYFRLTGVSVQEKRLPSRGCW